MNNTARRPVLPPLPSITNRRQFKVWLILQLVECGVELSTDPSYSELQGALIPIFERLSPAEG